MALPPTLEDQIATRIEASSLGVAEANPVNGPKQGVYISNPYDAINANRATRFGTNPKNPQADFVPSSDILIPVMPALKAKAVGYGTNPPSHAARLNEYLDWGAARAVRHPFVGVCESFACVSIAILAASNSPLAVNTRIEYIGVKQGSLGHAIVVINRANAVEAVGQTVPAPANWGAACIVVDQWYGLQAGISPVFHVAGPHANNAYVNFLVTGTTRTDVRGIFIKDGTRPAIPLRRA